MDTDREALRRGRAEERAFYAEKVIPAFEQFKAELEREQDDDRIVLITEEPNTATIRISHKDRGEFRCEVKASPRQEWQPFVEAVSSYGEEGERRVEDHWPREISRESILQWLSAHYSDHVRRKGGNTAR